MNAVIGFFRFWYDFIVGDDWTVAAAVVLSLAVTAWLSQLAGAWTVLPAVIVLFLGVSLWRAARRR